MMLNGGSRARSIVTDDTSRTASRVTAEANDEMLLESVRSIVGFTQRSHGAAMTTNASLIVMIILMSMRVAEMLEVWQVFSHWNLKLCRQDHDEPRLRRALAVAEHLEVAPEALPLDQFAVSQKLGLVQLIEVLDISQFRSESASCQDIQFRCTLAHQGSAEKFP